MKKTIKYIILICISIMFISCASIRISNNDPYNSNYSYINTDIWITFIINQNKPINYYKNIEINNNFEKCAPGGIRTHDGEKSRLIKSQDRSTNYGYWRK